MFSRSDRSLKARLSDLLLPLIFVLHTCAWAGLAAARQNRPWVPALAGCLTGMLSCLVLLQAVSFIFHPATRPFRLCCAGILLIQWLAYAYELQAGVPLEPALLRDYSRDVNRMGVWRMAASFLPHRFGLFWPVLVMVAMFLLPHQSKRVVRPVPAFSWLWCPVWLLTQGLSCPNPEPVTAFTFKAIVGCLFRLGASRPMACEPSSAKYPLLHTNAALFKVVGHPMPPPHVFLVFVESLKLSALDRCTSDGRPVTPFLNSLRSRACVFTNFFSCATYTIRAQEATLAGLIPTCPEEAGASLATVNVIGLPHILQQHGYVTVFLQAQADACFANTDTVMKRLGYQFIFGADDLEGADRRLLWGFGLQDDEFYRCALRTVDQIRARTGRSLFVTLASISSHAPFDVPARLRSLYPRPNGAGQMYDNAINAADRFLEELFVELAQRSFLSDSLVVILGDHGFPTGEHGAFVPTSFPYNESLAVPLFILWEGKLPPGSSGQACSQIDVASTLLDLLGIEAANHFAGHSLFESEPTSRPIPFVQPYEGGYVGAIHFPWKYVVNLTTGRERLYNLAVDSTERMDRIEDAAAAGSLRAIRRLCCELRWKAQLLPQNRLAPPTLESAGQPSPAGK